MESDNTSDVETARLPPHAPHSVFPFIQNAVCSVPTGPAGPPWDCPSGEPQAQGPEAERRPNASAQGGHSTCAYGRSARGHAASQPPGEGAPAAPGSDSGPVQGSAQVLPGGANLEAAQLQPVRGAASQEGSPGPGERRQGRGAREEAAGRELTLKARCSTK